MGTSNAYLGDPSYFTNLQNAYQQLSQQQQALLAQAYGTTTTGTSTTTIGWNPYATIQSPVQPVLKQDDVFSAYDTPKIKINKDPVQQAIDDAVSKIKGG
jgi:hypothetical protein